MVCDFHVPPWNARTVTTPFRWSMDMLAGSVSGLRRTFPMILSGDTCTISTSVSRIWAGCPTLSPAFGEGWDHAGCPHISSRLRAVAGHSISTNPSAPSAHATKLLHFQSSPRGQSPPDGVPMHVAQLLHRFLLAPHREIVITDLPQVGQILRPESARSDLFEHLHYY